jgi:phage terminase small subunit
LTDTADPTEQSPQETLPSIPAEKPKKARKLTAKQRRFAEAYTDIDNKRTFGNGTQSALLAYNITNPEVAKTVGSENIRKPDVLNYIEQLNAKFGNSIEDRSSLLALCMQGKLYSETTIQQLDDTGAVKSTTTMRKGVSPTQVLKAIDLSNKVEGIYNRANVAEHVAKREYDDLVANMRAELADRMKRTREVG